MLNIEYIVNSLSLLICIALGLWIFLRVHKLAGTLLIFTFSVSLIQGQLLVHMADFLMFEPKYEDGVFLDVEAITPWWYQVVMVLRTIASVALPVAIYQLAVQLYTKNS